MSHLTASTSTKKVCCDFSSGEAIALYMEKVLNEVLPRPYQIHTPYPAFSYASYFIESP